MFPSDNYLISTVFSFKQHFPHLGIGSVLPCLNYSYLDQHSPLLNHCSNPARHHLEPYIEYCKLSTIPHSQYHSHPHHSLNIIDGDWIHQNPYVLTSSLQSSSMISSTLGNKHNSLSHFFFPSFLVAITASAFSSFSSHLLNSYLLPDLIPCMVY